MGHNIKNSCYCFLLLFVLTCFLGSSQGESEAEILLKFRNSLSNYELALADWNDSSPGPCTGENPNWTGLRCSRNGSVFGLTLESMGLTGVIDVDELTKLPLLRTLSFMNNSFSGPFPDVNKLTALKALYLSYNGFSGVISEDGFGEMKALQKAFLARNNFSGKIPQSLAALPLLSQLSLEGNRFEGQIPDFRQKDDLVMVNVANNQLEGRIPNKLSKMSPSFFAGMIHILIFLPSKFVNFP